MTSSKNLLYASNLLLISILLGVINIVVIFFTKGSNPLSSGAETTYAAFVLLAILSFLIRQNIWVRWLRIVMLVFFILSLALSISAAKTMLHDNFLTAIIYLSGSVVQIWATLLLFKKDPAL